MASDKSRSNSVNQTLFEDDTGHTIQDYPGEIEGQYLLGVDEYGGWYYEPIPKALHNYQLSSDSESSVPLELRLEMSMNEEEVKDAFGDVSERSRDLIDKTRLGHSLVLASDLSNNTHLSRPQSEVYALREVFDVPRMQTARVLNKSENTVDNQLSRAKKKADMARKFIEIIREYTSE